MKYGEIMVRPKKVTYAGSMELVSGVIGVIPILLMMLANKFNTFESIWGTFDNILLWRGGFHFTIYLKQNTKY